MSFNVNVYFVHFRHFIYLIFFFLILLLLLFAEPVTFMDEVESVQREVNELLKENVTKIIALGHAGYWVDKKVAKEVKGLDIVVGGHTNTFLYTG